MSLDLTTSLKIAAAGMQVQGRRMLVVSENVANADSLGDTPGADPFRRKTIIFKNVLDRKLGADMVKVGRLDQDMSEFRIKHDPHHPLADENGNVKLPNVNTLLELMDLKEAQRSYQANLSVIDSSKMMLRQTLELIAR